MDAIRAEGLRKDYGDVHALAGVDLAVPEGTILGLLGPNGAGKTTCVRVLTTLLRPDAGTAEVAGIDVLKHPGEVRERIGLAGQYAAVDENLTGAENLEMVGQLFHLGRKPSRVRAAELLERFDLSDAARRPVKTYSGGMRRRLDLAAALVSRPPVLFLDEPTTGLDPRSRLSMWDLVETLVDGGTPVLLTTQYLDEADRLADTIAVIDTGRVIAEGTADELKDQVGGERVVVNLAPDADVEAALAALRELGPAEREGEDHTISVPVKERAGAVTGAVRRLDAAKVEVEDVALRRPTLDDVFLTLTGHAAEQAEADEAAASEERAA